MTDSRAETLRRRWVRLMQLATYRTPEDRKRARALARKVKSEMQREFIRERERQDRETELLKELDARKET